MGLTRTLTKRPAKTDIEGTTDTEIRRPSHSKMAKAVMREARAQGVTCTFPEASIFVSWLDGVLGDVRRCQRHPRGRYFMSEAQLATRTYDILEAVIPHGSTAKPGSAHAVLNAGLCRDNEVSIGHSQETRYSRKYCSVTLNTLTLN